MKQFSRKRNRSHVIEKRKSLQNLCKIQVRRNSSVRDCITFHHFFFRSFKVNNRLVIYASCLVLSGTINLCLLEIIWVFVIAYFEYGFETPGARFRLAVPCIPQKLMAVHLLLPEGEIIC